MRITRISRKNVSLALTARLGTGEAVPVTAVDVAPLPHGTTPDRETPWTPAVVHDGIVTFLVAGPDASTDDAVPVPAEGADVWGRVTDVPEVDAERLIEITVY